MLRTRRRSLSRVEVRLKPWSLTCTEPCRSSLAETHESMHLRHINDGGFQAPGGS
ncbi:MAG: hypothetical protein KME06_07800 [Kastovskya adunca ATA6-11-RM4]|jgi:hypothetical protein|nr:hypothetical protein [Kastovskya adunca ATA6-11-RM4]